MSARENSVSGSILREKNFALLSNDHMSLNLMSVAALICYTRLSILTALTEPYLETKGKLAIIFASLRSRQAD
jgi:hypothetical protein